MIIFSEILQLLQSFCFLEHFGGPLGVPGPQFEKPCCRAINHLFNTEKVLCKFNIKLMLECISST